MNLAEKHNTLSYALVNDFEDHFISGEAPKWVDLNASASFPAHSDYIINIWGEAKENGEKYFSVSLCQKSLSAEPDREKELFTAYAPRDDAYSALLDCVDKVISHFERSVQLHCEPISVPGPYEAYTKQHMQPLLDALNEGDFDRAAALTPTRYRLCGYQEFEEDYLYEQNGFGWAGQFERTIVPAGRYPVFVANYSYHEADGQFMNDVKDFSGLYIFLAGKCIADSTGRNPEEFPFDNTVWSSPYAHSVAHAIVNNASSIELLPPFKAVTVPFEYAGEEHITYKIIDESLPNRMKQNPMFLRNQSSYIQRTKDLSTDAKTLYDYFVRDFAGIGFEPGSGIPANNLFCYDAYSTVAMKELLDKGFVQNCDGDIERFGLTAKERLYLFHTGQANGEQRDSLLWDKEYNKCKKEAARKPVLEDQIQSASHRSSLQAVTHTQEHVKQPVQQEH